MRRTGGRSRDGWGRRPLIRRIAGWLAADGNPLRRRIDKAEMAMRVCLVVSFLVAAPLLAPVTGHLTLVSGIAQMRQERGWRQVNATLLSPAPEQFYGYGSMSTFWVRARWTAPDGAARVGKVPVRGGSVPGDVVPVWVDRAGRVTGHAPVSGALVDIRVALAGTATVAGIGLVLFALGGLLRIGTNRRRMRHWAAEWACFGPRWTTRRWPRS